MNKILLIEDDKDLAEALEAKLKKADFEVTIAYNGEDGGKIAFSDKPDAIILDLILPGGKDGIELLKEIRADDWGKNVPILILTNMDDIKHISLAVEHKSNDYIVKSDTTLDEIVVRLKDRMHI